MAVVFGLFGLIIGSFLNVVVLRWEKEGESPWLGRSHCMSCGAQIAWYDNIPLVSWVVLGGRCRQCKARISIQYPLVEALAAVLFAFIAASGVPLPQAIFLCTVASLLIIIAVYDLRSTYIPDAWNYTFIALAFVSLFLFPSPVTFMWAFLGGPIAAAPLFLLWLISRGEWMGFGDVKLALGMGWLLGPLYGVMAVFFAFIVGAVVSVGILLPLPRLILALRSIGITVLDAPHGGFTMGSEIPFGPFLVASTIIIWLLLIYSVDPLALVGLAPL